jgi:hypothetical protein
MAPRDPVLKRAVVDLITGDVQHGTDIANMFFGAAFLIELKFANDDVLRRSQGNGATVDGVAFLVLESPGMEFITGCEIDISLQARLMVKDVEMAAQFACALDDNYFLRWQIRGRKNRGEPWDMAFRSRTMRSMSWVTRGSP